jgi:exosortase A
MTAMLPIAAARPHAGSDWQRHLIALAAAALGLLILFHRDAAGMAAAWWTSATFNHVLLIPPLLAWLVWQRKDALAELAPAAWWPGLVVVAFGALAWLLGEAAGATLARHTGLVLMLQGAVAACLGPAIVRGLAFPLFFALFLIPAGEEIVPQMQVLTARLSTVFLGWAGIPAHLDGIFITTPGGYFEVAEACAGVMFLVAMLAYGALVANLCFRSWRRRALFMAAAVAIPVLANGVRAFGTIWLAGRYGIEFAAGFDHVFYGWIFFAIVIALIMAAGWPFFDRRPGDPWIDPAKLGGARAGPPPARVAAAVIGLAAIPLLWSAALSPSVPPSRPATLPDVPGWQRGAASDWQPDIAGARTARYTDAQGQAVDLAVAIVPLDSLPPIATATAGAGWAWTSPGGAAPPGARADRIASHGRVREVVSAWRVGNSRPTSATGMKLAVMRTRLFGGPPVAAVAMVSAESRPALDAFLAASGPLPGLADRALPGGF